MVESTKQGDFIELEFLGMNSLTKEVFDTNILEEAKKINPDIKETKPLVVCIGKGMIVKGFDEALEGKETGKKYSIKLSAEKGFGKRNPSMTKLIPMKFFQQQKIMPQPGMTLALDNMLVKVSSVSGGRVLVDFNNPLAGKDIEYDFIVKKIITDIKEKIIAIQKFLFGRDFPFEIEEANKKIVFQDIQLTSLLQAFAPQFKEMLSYNVEILAKKDKTETKKETEKKDEETKK